VPIVLKSGNISLLEPSGSVQACNGIAFTINFTTKYDRQGSVTVYLRKYASDNVKTVEIVGKCPKYMICFDSIDVINA